MATVAGVSQLMETVVPATPSVASSAAPEQSFATAMHQANQDAGVPLAPVEQKGPAKPDDANAKADTTQKQASPEAPATDMQAIAAKPNAVAAPPATARYTSANMLSAMLGAIVPAGGDPIANVAATPSPAIPTLAPAVTLATPATPGDLPVQAAAPTIAGPVDPSPPVPPAFLVVAPSAKLAAKAGASPTHAPAPRTKGEAPKLAGAAGAPVLVAAPDSVAAPTLPTLTAAIGPLPDTAIPVANTDKVASKVANVAAGQSATASPSSGVVSAVAPIVQPSAVTFQQSLAVQAVPVATTPLQATTEVPAAAAAWPVTSPVGASGNKPFPTHPDSTAVVGPQYAGVTSVSSGAPAALPNAVASALPLSAAIHEGGQVQASVPQAQPQTSPVHKAFAKSALSVEASQTASGATQAELPPVAPPSAAESKTAPHSQAAAVGVPAAAPAADAAMAVATPVATVHTPLAVSALIGSAGPALATSTTAAATSPYATSTHATSDALQHTTLSSTPTTLEVGVASGTHGWLKIRAELNASGTVDASLTGANAAATGRLHNELPALSSFLQDERVALGSLNVAAPGAIVSALHAASTLEAASSFTRSAAEGVGATDAAVAGDAGASGGRAPQQQAPEGSPLAIVLREDDAVAASVTASIIAPAPSRYGEANDLGISGELSRSAYGSGGGSRLNVRV